jgi:glycine cleavage system H protein
MSIPKDLLYTKEHEWIRIQGDTGVVGITEYAQQALGDITFVELPKTGASVKQSQLLATIESVKAASDIYAPMSGRVLEVNAALEDAPGRVNAACYADGWIAKIKIEDAAEKKNLMDGAAYEKFLETVKH